MNSQELQEKLAITQNKFVLTQNVLTSKVSDFLVANYDGQPVVITEAQAEPGGDPKQEVRISGRSSFLNVPDLPVSARFTVDAQGELQAVLKYQLRDGTPGPAAWKFSQSFPQLPKVLDYNTPLPMGFPRVPFDREANQRPFLDALELFETFLVVSTHPGQDPESGVPLEAGINFVSKLRPEGMVGVLEHFMGDAKPLVLYGTIRVPKATDNTLPLQPSEYPWSRPAAPGIHLQAALETDCKLGKMVFNQSRFRVYSPLTTDWMAQNDSFQPVHGYTGTLGISSAGIEVQLGADLKWNMPRALLYGSCEGITLGKLTQLLDLTGSDGLSSHLPQELQKAVDTLDKLELMHVAVELAVNGVTPSIDAVYCTIGMPNLKWQVWGDHLEVESIACRFAIHDPFRTSATSTAGAAQGSPATPISVTVFGTLDVEGVPLDISASSDTGFTVTAFTQKPEKLPLDKLLKAHAPGVPAPGALTVNKLGVSVAPGQSYSMTALLAAAPDPWTLEVGPEKLTISDAVLHFTSPTAGPLSGFFGGKISFAEGVSLTVNYNIPGNFIVRGDFRRVNLSHLIDKLCNQKVPMPGGFDLIIQNASVVIQKQGEAYTFQLVGTAKDAGVFAFEVRKLSGGGWGFATGVDLSSGRISQLPGLSALHAFEDAFRLQKLMLVVSSFEDAGFRFPDMAQFNRPQLATKNVALPAQATGVLPGLMAFAEWQLNASDRQHNLLKQLLGLSATQSVTLAIGKDPTKEARLYVRQRTTLFGHPFECQFGAELNNGKPTLFLTGTITVPIQGHPQTFDVTMAFAPGGAFLSGDMKGSTGVDCGPFKLSNLALEVGVNWGGIPSLGIAATIDVKKFESSVAVFFDSTNPAHSLVAGSLSPLTMKDVVDTLLGGSISSSIDGVLDRISIQGTREFSIPGALADELDGLSFDKVSAAFSSAAKLQLPSSSSQLLLVVNQKGSAWHLTDLTTMRHYELKRRGDQIAVSIAPQFYFAPMATSIGTVKFPQGYYLNAALSFLGFKAEATIDISIRKGASIDAQMDRIVIGNEALFCLAAAKGDGGPRISVSTFAQPDHPVPEFRLPHFYVNGSLELLGVKESVFATLTTSGLEFELKGALLPGMKFDVHARFGGSGLEAGGELKVGVGTLDLGPLGKVRLDTDVEASLDIDVDGKKIDISVEASFEFAGEKLHIAKFNLDAKPNALAQLPDQLGRKAEKELSAVFKDMGKWANAVSKGLVDGVQDTSKVFKDVYGKSEQEAKALANGLGKGTQEAAKQVAQGVNQASKDVSQGVNQASKDVSKTAKKAKKALKKIF